MFFDQVAIESYLHGGLIYPKGRDEVNLVFSFTLTWDFSTWYRLLALFAVERGRADASSCPVCFHSSLPCCAKEQAELRDQMKKSKRSFELEDRESGTSGKIGIELDKHNDEEIIDLEDIIERDGQVEEEDELDLGVELIDLESDMDFKEIGSAGSTEDDALEEDLLRGLPIDEPAQARGAGAMAASLDDDEAADLLKDFSMDAVPSRAARGARKGDVAGVRGMDDPLEGLIFAEEEEKAKADTSFETGALRKERISSVGDVSTERSRPASSLDSVVEETVALSIAARPAIGGLAVSSMETSSIDATVDEIETRLTDMVRDMVEAKLPEIVREVLREEIRKLKAELK